MKPVVIAIDGPSASGKSTVAWGVARALGYVYADSGAIYRTVTWEALKRKIDLQNEASLLAMVKKLKVEFKLVNGQVEMWVDGYYPQKEIRTTEVSAAVPHVAVHPRLRQWVVGHQRAMTSFGNLVMEGRDIGSVVFPEVAHKFYLDAKPEVRAQRRHKQGVLEVLQARDQRDSARRASPLMVALGAQVVDTSSLTVEQVVEKILAVVKGG